MKNTAHLFEAYLIAPPSLPRPNQSANRNAIIAVALPNSDVLLVPCIAGQFSSECWCGSGTPAQTYELYGQLPDSACDKECTGAGPEGEACGGSFKMSVYMHSA